MTVGARMRSRPPGLRVSAAGMLPSSLQGGINGVPQTGRPAPHLSAADSRRGAVAGPRTLSVTVAPGILPCAPGPCVWQFESPSRRTSPRTRERGGVTGQESLRRLAPSAAWHPPPPGTLRRLAPSAAWHPPRPGTLHRLAPSTAWHPPPPGTLHRELPPNAAAVHNAAPALETVVHTPNLCVRSNFFPRGTHPCVWID